MEKDFIYGVDLGWVNQFEARGIYWIDKNGNRTDPIQALKAMGANAVRLRVFVNPPKEAYWHKYEKRFEGKTFGNEDCMLGFCDKESVLEMAKRVKALDMRLMIDFHYSDHFADPVYQDIPKEWANDSFEMLKERVAQHTKEVLTLLTVHAIYPEWIQVGNEVNSGILLPVGSISDAPEQFTALLNTGYDSVKVCCPDSQVVTHISGGMDFDKCAKFFETFFQYGGKTDIMGFSYYPYWEQAQHEEEKLRRDMEAFAAKYQKPVMLSEIGSPENEEEESYQLLKSAVRAIKAVSDGQGLGLFYWEPDAGADFLPDHYILGAARKAGENCLQFTKAMSAYME